MPEDGWDEGGLFEEHTSGSPGATKPEGDGGAGSGKIDTAGADWGAAAIKGLSGFDLPPGYTKAAVAIITAIATGFDTGERLLPVGWGSDLGLERWARRYCEADPRADLGVMYGLAAVATMTCAQGGLMLRAPKAEGGWLEVPAIMHFMAEADSGWRKSTALAAVKRPMDRALALGVARRRDIAADAAKATMAAAQAASGGTGSGANDSGGGGVVGDADYLKELRKQVNEVFGAGVCPLTYIKDPTVEALRNLAVDNGGCAAVLSGEADVFRNLTAYGGDAGALTFFLDLWDQDSIETARVSGGVKFMRNVALNLAVLFQTEVFAEVTGGGRGVRGSDSFVSRGVFGRAWVVEAFTSGGHEATAAAYSDKADVTWSGLDGLGAGDGVGALTPLGEAQVDLEAAWGALVADTDVYRAVKGRLRAWESGAMAKGADWLVPRSAVLADLPTAWGGGGQGGDDVPRGDVALDVAGRLEYRRVQRLQAALEAAIGTAEDDIRMMWSPLISRVVQHVLRDALATELAAGGRVVRGAAVADAAVRLLPWRWGMMASALVKRADEIAGEALAASAAGNPKGESRDTDDIVRKVLIRMAREEPARRAHGFGREEIIRKALSTVNPKTARRGMSPLLRKALEAMAARPGSGVTAVPGAKDATGKPSALYVVDKALVP